jgi:hypothetical protein
MQKRLLTLTLPDAVIPNYSKNKGGRRCLENTFPSALIAESQKILIRQSKTEKSKLITHASRNDYMKNGNYVPTTKKRHRKEAMADSKPGLLIWKLSQRWER